VVLDAIPSEQAEMKIAALAPFPFVGLEFGGAERISNLLTRVDHELDVFVPNYGDAVTGHYKNLKLNFVHISESLRQKDWDKTVADSAKDLLSSRLKDYELVILEHPWQVQALSGQRFVYDAHNNETEIKKLTNNPELIDMAQRLETDALLADHVTFCSLEDYIPTASPKTHIPNGTDLPELTGKNGYGSKVLFFMGSSHPPNIAAAITLAYLAPALPNYQIVLAGNCTNDIEAENENITILKHVGPELLDYLMRSSHAFVNLIGAGSGTSLKVVRAMSYGLPVISSRLGARGFEEGAIIADTAQEVIEALAGLQTRSVYTEASEKALMTAQGYSWDKIGADFNKVIQGML
jgi:glycosyltransferase involved in cell wall biosynthesis